MNQERLSDTLLDILNRLYDAKLSGINLGKEFEDLIVLTGRFYASLIKSGDLPQEQVDEFENLLISDPKAFRLRHDGLPRAVATVKQGNTAALLGQSFKRL